MNLEVTGEVLQQVSSAILEGPATTPALYRYDAAPNTYSFIPMRFIILMCEAKSGID